MSFPTLSARSSFESLHSNSSSIISSPDKLAPAVTGPSVWQGDELNPAEYVVELDDGDIRNIRAAIIKFKRECYLVVIVNKLLIYASSFPPSADEDKPENF
jgi:hypothetical protein